MAASIQGPRIAFSNASDVAILNCPIKKIKLLNGASQFFFIDGVGMYIASGSELKFDSVYGYPGAEIRLSPDFTGTAVLLIEEIGDVLNPNYFKEDIRNWNGQGAAASVSEASEAPKKATKAKKAEVNE